MSTTPSPSAATAGGAPAGYRSLTVLGAAAFVFALSLIGTLWGGLNFPDNAPVEQIYCALTVIDLVVGFAIATTGAIIASRSKRPVARRSVASLVGAALVAIALAGWILVSGIGIVHRIATGVTPHYADDVSGAVFFGIPWIVGTVLCAFGYRRGGTTINSILALGGVIVGLLLAAATVTSAVIYGLGFST